MNPPYTSRCKVQNNILKEDFGNQECKAFTKYFGKNSFFVANVSFSQKC